MSDEERFKFLQQKQKLSQRTKTEMRMKRFNNRKKQQLWSIIIEIEKNREQD